MIQVLKQILNILKVTGYKFDVESDYISDTNWRIDIKYGGTTNRYAIAIFPDEWVFYYLHRDEPIKSYPYKSTIYNPEFTNALHKMYTYVQEMYM